MGRIIHNIIICQVLFLVVLSSAVPTVICFSTTTTTTTTSTSTLSHLSGGTALFSSNKREELEQEAQDLLAKAQKLRLEIGDDGKHSKTTQQQQQQQQPKLSEWSVDSQEPQQYRLYIDIGREEGTWMDPRWGASGKRIEGTLDLCFSSSKADPSIEDKMVLDNQRGQSSSTYVIETGKKMRLKSGFDSMAVKSGGYRVDFTKNGGTLRFYFQVEGTQNSDISIPQGCLYVSLPCFMTSRDDPQQMMLSTKEGIASVRQMGWHTGWRREESRIVGVVRAVPIDKARRVDGF